jgi:hypothetical protein
MIVWVRYALIIAFAKGAVAAPREKVADLAEAHGPVVSA